MGHFHLGLFIVAKSFIFYLFPFLYTLNSNNVRILVGGWVISRNPNGKWMLPNYNMILALLSQHVCCYMSLSVVYLRIWDTFHNKVPIRKSHNKHVESASVVHIYHNQKCPRSFNVLPVEGVDWKGPRSNGPSKRGMETQKHL